MSNLLKRVVIGASLGAAAGVAVSLLNKQKTDESDKPADESNKPLISPGVSMVLMAALAGLDPLFKDILETAKGAIDQVLERGAADHDTDEQQEDGGDDEQQEDGGGDEPQPNAPAGTAEQPIGPDSTLTSE